MNFLPQSLDDVVLICVFISKNLDKDNELANRGLGNPIR
jgi:hypothetical protein